MRLWVGYFRLHRKAIVLYVLCVVIFGVVFSFYDLPLEPVLYALVLSLTVVVCVVVPDFQKCKRKHLQLRDIGKHVQVSIEQLPEPDGLLEEDCQELIRTLFRYKCEGESRFAMRYQDMMDYYSMWAHQIKTPIAAMRLLLQTEVHHAGGELEEQLFRIEQYVEMVLQYMRLEDSGSDLVIRQYSLDGIVRQAVHKYAKSFICKKIRLEYAQLDRTVITDEKWMVFVVEQLLSNGLKYTKSGQISIYMNPKRPAQLIIEDTGIGIEPEDLPRIFEKGFTGYNGRREKKSTGIGLYLCKMVLTKLSHTIEVESVVGKGTKIKIGLEQAKLQVD